MSCCDVRLEELDRNPHPVLARIREQAPVCWVPELGGWLVTGYEAAVTALTSPDAFTVDDPRFTTARVTGPSMLSLDGAEHGRHRAPFTHPFKPAEVEARMAAFTTAEAARLTDAIRPDGQAELRTTVAGPLAAAVMAEALGLVGTGVTPGEVLSWYRDIVTAVSELPASGQAGGGAGERVPVASFGKLAERLLAAMDAGAAPLLGHAARDDALKPDEVVANAAVMLFGGIETTEGMIANALLHLLSQPGRTGACAVTPNAIEESLRLEPAAAVVDRYATGDVTLAGAAIRRGDLVTVSLAGANRDPAVFAGPDRFDSGRANAARHLSFARGPHFCLGAHLARLETVTAVTTLMETLPRLWLDTSRPAPEVRGLVFRKPAALHGAWDA